MKKILLFLLIPSISIFSGSLDDFEKEIRKKPKYETENKSSSSSESCMGDACGSIAGEICGSILSTVAEESCKSISSRNNNGTNTLLFPERDPGDFLMPVFRVDSNYSYISNNLFSINNRIEGGYGLFACSMEYNIYNELNPEDRLYQFSFLVLTRLKLIDELEISPSFGYHSLIGNNVTDGFKIGTVIRVSPIENVGIEFRPHSIISQYNSIFDFDGSIHWSFRNFGITFGYKYFGNNSTTMQGVYTGLRFFY